MPNDPMTDIPIDLANEICWSREPQSDRNLFWHWSGDPDAAPLPLHVTGAYNGRPAFVNIGQYGLTRAIDVADYGGWWTPVIEPEVPHEFDDGCYGGYLEAPMATQRAEQLNAASSETPSPPEDAKAPPTPASAAAGPPEDGTNEKKQHIRDRVGYMQNRMVARQILADEFEDLRDALDARDREIAHLRKRVAELEAGQA